MPGPVILEQHLAQAERHVAEGADHVARQREIVAELANDDRDLKSAQALLVQFETMQAHHIATETAFAWKAAMRK
jgi:hypothetical protein